MKNKNHNARKVLIIIMTVLIIGALITGCGTKEKSDSQKDFENQGESEAIDEIVINLNDYIDFRYGGRNGQGYISEVWLGDRSDDATKELIEDLNRYTVGMYNENTLYTTLGGYDNHEKPPFEVSPVNAGGNLSNGDKVSIVWKINERGLRLLQQQVPKVKFVWENFEDEVYGLANIIEVDPFDRESYNAYIGSRSEDDCISGETIITEWYVELRETGTVSYREVNIEIDTMGHVGPWSNGDQVKITITEDDDYLLEEFGVVLTAKTGIVTVDWLQTEGEY